MTRRSRNREVTLATRLGIGSASRWSDDLDCCLRAGPVGERGVALVHMLGHGPVAVGVREVPALVSSSSRAAGRDRRYLFRL